MSHPASASETLDPAYERLKAALSTAAPLWAATVLKVQPAAARARYLQEESDERRAEVSRHLQELPDELPPRLVQAVHSHLERQGDDREDRGEQRTFAQVLKGTPAEGDAS